jgi:hypothetical protein
MASARRVALVSAGDGSGCLFVVDEVGLIRVIGPDGTLEPEPFLDLRSRIVSPMAGVDERGLLGLAFHPRYADNGRFFAYYSAPLGAGAPAGYDHMSHASEFRRLSDGSQRVDPGSERIALQLDEPQFNEHTYLVTTYQTGPTGTTEEEYRLVRPRG